MDELNEFISMLNAESRILQDKGLMTPAVDEPWRYYSLPLDDEHEFELLRATIESGKFVVEAETLIQAGDEAGAWRALAKAQQALLKSLSAKGKSEAKKEGQTRGGRSRVEDQHERIFVIADKLLNSGEKWRGLSKKVAEKLNDLHPMEENKIREILNSQKHLLLNR